MLPSQRRTPYLFQCWMKNYYVSILNQNHSFCTLSKESKSKDSQERLRKLEAKYKPNTSLPKKIGQLANVHKDQLVYIPKINLQLNPELYSSSQSFPNSPKKNELNNDLSKDSEPLKSCIYKYTRKYIRGNKSEIKESLQFGLFAVVSLGAPAILFGTMYNFPDWTNRMIGYMTFEWLFYWTQAGFMAFLVAGFFVALKYQTGRWFRLLLRKIYGSTMHINKISILPNMNIMNIEYCHNTLFNKKRLSLTLNYHQRSMHKIN